MAIAIRFLIIMFLAGFWLIAYRLLGPIGLGVAMMVIAGGGLYWIAKN